MSGQVHELILIRVCAGHGKTRKSRNLSISVSRPGKSWSLIVNHGKSWKIVVQYVWYVNYCRCQSKDKIKYRQVLSENTQKQGCFFYDF